MSGFSQLPPAWNNPSASPSAPPLDPSAYSQLPFPQHPHSQQIYSQQPYPQQPNPQQPNPQQPNPQQPYSQQPYPQQSYQQQQGQPYSQQMYPQKPYPQQAPSTQVVVEQRDPSPVMLHTQQPPIIVQERVVINNRRPLVGAGVGADLLFGMAASRGLRHHHRHHHHRHHRH
ncbi:gamma-gliadin-like [Homarus americanus]|uniref:gamma-gliadin-like n=1 Tax=Homarus americanus TaxID=6706 RepID=UPI001C460D54|nr:gamma-gliadin-like [Homarus americanus]